MAVKAIPDGYRTVTPSLTIKGAAKLIEFIEAAFGGKEVFRMPAPSREIMHAEITMGDFLIMLNDAIGQSPTTAPLFLYVNDDDRVYASAVRRKVTRVGAFAVVMFRVRPR
jgi:PhnB protein